MIKVLSELIEFVQTIGNYGSWQRLLCKKNTCKFLKWKTQLYWNPSLLSFDTFYFLNLNRTIFFVLKVIKTGFHLMFRYDVFWELLLHIFPFVLMEILKGWWVCWWELFTISLNFLKVFPTVTYCHLSVSWRVWLR